MDNVRILFHSPHQELASSLDQHQPRVEQLGSDTLRLKQLVARSRPGVVRQHADVQRIERDVEELVGRWEALTIQTQDR